ncbi:putative uncharacterized protein [Coprococcus eutactus CAG:665]|nr:putative uncharacterized protein [Coprococcus eutactus CAG:665]
MDKEVIAKRLISLRGDKTQVDVAKALGISQSTYAMYETGKRVPTDEIKIKIAAYYNTTVQDIFFKHILA